MSHLKKCKQKELISPPIFVFNQLQYEVIMGSNAYGVSSDSSDLDIYGICIPPKESLFNNKYIHGFDNPINNFEQFQKHGIELGKVKYDFTIYNITKYFRLALNGNPNILDALFVPFRCITYCTEIGNYIRENRKIFLTKKCWSTFKGYSYSQMHKMNIKEPEEGSKRYESIKKYGYDVKFAYHVVRLLNEVEQILIEGDLDLERNREQLKSIRRGEWTKEQITQYFQDKEKSLEQTYLNSKLPYSPNEQKIKQILINCLEMHYGNLEAAINKNTNENYVQMINEIETSVQRIKEYFQNKK